jgi:hypothetical protein
VLEAAFVLLEPSSPSRNIFIGSHSLPPLWFAVSVLHTFKLFEGAPEQLDDKLCVVVEWFLVGVLGRRLLPLIRLLPTVAFVVIVLPSSPLRWWRAPRHHLLLLSVNDDL